MLDKSRRAIVVGIIMWLIPCIGIGQGIDYLPAAGINTRFYTDVFFQNKPDSGIYPTKHPGLTVNGFNNGGDNSHGYGLKQILERGGIFHTLSIRGLLSTRSTIGIRRTSPVWRILNFL